VQVLGHVARVSVPPLIALDLMGSVYASRLQLNRNMLQSLPLSIGDIRHLEVLDISSNDFAVSCFRGCIRRAPGMMCGVASTLQEFPECLGNLRTLRTLLMTQNSIEELPDCIGRLHQLRLFDVRVDACSA
jgi:Leucine-rich repeat (LRR) protein